MQKNTNIDINETIFSFTNQHGEIVASFTMNPTDPRILKRCKNMVDIFSTDKRFSSALEWETFIEEKFCEFLGYDCKQSLFDRVAATEILSDGRSFAAHILDTLVENLAPEIRRCREENLARYTAKYNK